MENKLIGLRAQDFHEGLRHTGAFGPKDAHYAKTLLIGKAASLAMHLPGLLFIEDMTQLQYAASSLGIGGELTLVLKELEEVDFLSIVKAGDEIKRIELRIPEFKSAYSDLGERWKIIKPSEIEQASIYTLDQLYNGPILKSQLVESLGISKSGTGILLDIMQSGNLLSVQPIDGQPTTYTPLAVDGNPTAYLNWAKKFPSDVQTVLSTLQMAQGLPMESSVISGNSALLDAVATGVLMPVQVSGSTGERRFLFAPKGGLAQDERTILDKARAIVSCVRYGENYAASRKIKYPRRIIETLRDNKRFKRGHPDLFDQYGLLVEKMIGHPVDVGGGKWNFEVDDTRENMKALHVAIEMVEHGESPATRIDLDAQQELFTPTAYLSPGSTRPIITKTIIPSKETRGEIIREMVKLARGTGG